MCVPTLERVPEDHSRETRELAGAVGEGATPCTDGRPSENTPAWTASHQSSLPNAAKGNRIHLETSIQRDRVVDCELLAVRPAAATMLKSLKKQLGGGKKQAKAKPPAPAPAPLNLTPVGRDTQSLALQSARGGAGVARQNAKTAGVKPLRVPTEPRGYSSSRPAALQSARGLPTDGALPSARQVPRRGNLGAVPPTAKPADPAARAAVTEDVGQQLARLNLTANQASKHRRVAPPCPPSPRSPRAQERDLSIEGKEALLTARGPRKRVSFDAAADSRVKEVDEEVEVLRELRATDESAAPKPMPFKLDFGRETLPRHSPFETLPPSLRTHPPPGCVAPPLPHRHAAPPRPTARLQPR